MVPCRRNCCVAHRPRHLRVDCTDLKRKKQAQAECIECGHMDALQVLLKESGITVLDVTTMPIESAANQVIKCLDERFPDHMHVGIHCPNGSNHREGPSW